MVELDCLGVVSFKEEDAILELGGCFVVVVLEVKVENFDLVVGCVIGLVL